MKVFFTKAAPFGALWTLTNYLYLYAVTKINTTDASVLFCCNKAFVFLLSWIVLRDRFMGVRVSPLLPVSFPRACPPGPPTGLLGSACGAVSLAADRAPSDPRQHRGPVLGVPRQPSCLQTIPDEHS